MALIGAMCLCIYSLCRESFFTDFVAFQTSSKGELYQFAKNVLFAQVADDRAKQNFIGNEFAGACFSPNGKTLFVNIQTPGITFAIWGPWNRNRT